jgi:RNA polymerase sigma-70 factor (ECF subfamily)
MEQLREPAERAVARLYEQYHQPILRYLERLCGSHELAEDLAQETFLKALRHWEQLVAVEGAAAWLFRIARHMAFDEHRRRRRSPGVPLTDLHLDTLAGKREELAIEELEPIRAALAQLQERYRQALLLHSYAGYPIETIAASLGWKVGTVKSRLSRARAQFRRHYLA